MNEPLNDNKQLTDRDGNVYKNLREKMMYYMRRRRNSDKPHYPQREGNGA